MKEPTLLFDGSQLALEMRPFLHNIDHLYSFEALDYQTQVALPALYSANLGHARVPKDILLGRHHRVALVHGLVGGIPTLY